LLFGSNACLTFEELRVFFTFLQVGVFDGVCMVFIVSKLKAHSTLHP